jgi:3'-phosphoadenosine 5'-phosphosulfate sulfotransferase (PAPS reductase)/FAD synthetase
MKNAQYIIFASYGNDSIALIQWAKEHNLENVTVLYSDTGWAANWWEERVIQGEDYAKGIGFKTARTKSIGLEQLVRDKKAWPRQGIQFCTEKLKIVPSTEWLNEHDHAKNLICMIGIRRAESANRANWPEWVSESISHGGRKLWAPMIKLSDIDRNELILRAGFKPLPHRSMECFPCINSNRHDLLELAKDEDRIAKIEKIEMEMGITSKGKPRTMFRPYRYMGATGIREIIKWAESPRGKYVPKGQNDQGELFLDDGTGGGACNSGWCGI